MLNLSGNVHATGLRILLVIAVGLNANVLFAQHDFREGYLITLTNDSTRGWIKDTPAEISSGKCEFRSREGSPAEIFNPGTINGFGFSEEDRFYESLVIGSGKNETTKVFPEKLRWCIGSASGHRSRFPDRGLFSSNFAEKNLSIM